MSDFAAFLRDRLAESAGHAHTNWERADTESKQRIVDEHPNVNDGSCGTCVTPKWGYPTHGGASPAPWPCTTLRLLALPYANVADYPDYRQEWRP